ncbi:MAG: tetratricopeptide repeat protein [Rikenellaceae bacterium]|nr:tetratricopeptide repeat protein [Rikenellaceae bacterium]
MKRVKFLLSALLAFAGVAAMAQSEEELAKLADPAYAKWGDTPLERYNNVNRSSFLKEALQNKNYNEAASHYLYLVEHAPTAAESIYQRGEQVYLRKWAQQKTVATQRQMFDSVLMVYDHRLQYFGTTPEAKAEILDRRARQYAKYGKRDREGLREAFRLAIAADVDAMSAELAETVALYFANLVDDYKNDEVYADEVLAEYERLSPIYETITTENEPFKESFETAFGTSGVASCDNLETMFRKKLANDPNNLDVLNQAVALMGRAKCTCDFFFEITERQYALAPSANTAIFLAQGFQERGDLDKATNYLREALKTETESESRQNLLVQLGMVELASNRVSAAMQVAKEIQEIDEDNAYAYFLRAQCYAASGCQEAYWVAFDTMKKAEELFVEENLKEQAKTLAQAYAGRWPLSNDERFFMEGIKHGDTVTVPCGVAAGLKTTARFR